MPFIFITGGCRSGKSAYAQNLAEKTLKTGHALFIASAHVRDPEMEERVRRHQQARGPRWLTHEPAPGGECGLHHTLPGLARGADVLLFDCLTLWVSAYMEAVPKEAEKDEEIHAFTAACGRLLDALRALPCPVIVVSNEVGLGVVPANGETRLFRDYAGLANQMAAARADAAVFMVSGLPLLLKGQALP